jgi:GTP-binding protein
MSKIKTSTFLTSATSIKDAPVNNLPEFIIVGRSNVGKSSFINTLCNRKNLAYIGKHPGKTRLINLFQINEDFILTDLPGYGYAKRSAAEQQKWKKRIEEYLLNRKEIIRAIQLIDSRHEIQQNDFQMREWLDYYKIPILTVFTKMDYVSKSKVKKLILNHKNTLNTEIYAFSAKTKLGKEEIVKLLFDIISDNS